MGRRGLMAALVVTGLTAWGIAAVHMAQTEERAVGNTSLFATCERGIKTGLGSWAL